MRWFLFLFTLGVVQTSWLGRLTFINFSVTFVMPCRFLRCCSYMRKAQVKFLICKWMHDPWKRIQIEIKPKTALNLWLWVSLLSKENPQLLPQLKHTHYTFPLDNQRASAWNITSLCLLSCLCTLLQTFDASMNVRGWISQFLTSSRTICRSDLWLYS